MNDEARMTNEAGERCLDTSAAWLQAKAVSPPAVAGPATAVQIRRGLVTRLGMVMMTKHAQSNTKKNQPIRLRQGFGATRKKQRLTTNNSQIL
jgi:hypothetical protein